MFCPKCGTENPETGKFCRSCGVDLGDVSLALSGGLAGKLDSADADCGWRDPAKEARRRADPNEVYADAVRAVVSGIGFLIVSMALLITGVAGGKAWWWALLFPAFTFLAKGISDLLKSRRMSQTQAGFSFASGNMIGQNRQGGALPPSRTEYVMPVESRYKTGDLVPPSVTDDTTRHLEMNTEGKTMTLPEK